MNNYLERLFDVINFEDAVFKIVDILLKVFHYFFVDPESFNSFEDFLAFSPKRQNLDYFIFFIVVVVVVDIDIEFFFDLSA